MKNSFPILLNKFFKALENEFNYSNNTIISYKYTFKLLVKFLINEKHIPLEKISFEKITKDIIREFLDNIEIGSSINTRNQRLGAIKSFYRYTSTENIDNISNCEQILSIRRKKCTRKYINYLTVQETKDYFQHIELNCPKDLRNLALLTLLYDTAARASELLNIKVDDLILDNNPKVTLYGKGKKIRRIPITNNTKEIIIRYINEFKIGRFSYLFSNNKGEKYTTKMLEHVIKKYCKKADIRKNIHPHSFRHSKAMHLLEAGVNLIYIRDLLGHSSIKTTEIYARTNEELLRKKIREANDIKINKEIPKWHKDEQLLKSLLDL